MSSNDQNKRVKQTDKPFWGVYFNQARLNAYITLCHISELLGEKTVDEDSLFVMPVLRHLDSQKDMLKSPRVFEFIDKHFPMLSVIYAGVTKEEGIDEKIDASNRSKKYKEIMTCLLKALSQFRNENCHAATKKEEGNNSEIKTLLRYLNLCFDAAVSKVKIDRKLDEKEVIHLRRKIQNKDKQAVDNPAFFYHFRDENEWLTEKGLAFLASLFLEKRDIFLFLRQLTGFCRDDMPGYKATLESYCCYRIRVPKPVVVSDDDEAGLSLDMLNELKKCPGELFELLSKDKQKEFRVQEITENGDESAEILMRRYSDRFPYFALRFCDDREVFQRIRFHVDLGRYYFDFYDKTTIDGGIYPRSLDKQLKTFGRIRDVREDVERQWGDILKSPGERDEDSTGPYKARTTPHYHIVDNQIGFVLNPQVGLPDISKPDGRITLRGPDAWLSVYELPGLLFYGLRCGFDKVEELLGKYINEQKEICRQVQESGRIENRTDTFLPEALKNASTGNKTQNSYAQNKLKRVLAETEQRLRAIEATEKRMADPGNKPGKKNFFDIRAGKLADFLVRDILAMQAFDSDKNGSDKLTSINFQVLQAALAYWGAKRQQVGDIFKTSGLLDGENPHPFLNRVNFSRCCSISEFYTAYLREKEVHLKDCMGNKKYDAQFLRPSRERYAGGGGDLKTIAGKLLEHPVNIPKGFFEEKIRELVCGELPSVRKAKMNTAYLIQAWFAKTYGRVQPVYSCVRTYPVVLKAGEYAKKRKNSGIRNTLSSITPQMGYVELEDFIQKEIPNKGKYDPKRLKDNLIAGCRDFKNNERLLRRMKVQDMILFMMAEETLKEQLALEGHALRLEQITPTENSPFKMPIECKTSIPVVFLHGLSYEQAYISFIEKKYPGLYESNDKRVTLRYRITSKNTKFGDMGKYRRYLYDRRLKGLLVWKYPPNAAEITYDEIQKEIEAYERHRVEIFRLLYQMEEAVIDGCKMEPDLHKNYIPFKEGIVEIIKEKHANCAAMCDTLVNIRNAVNHNQFPAYNDAIEQAGGGYIAEKMKTITEIYVEQILKKGFNHE